MINDKIKSFERDIKELMRKHGATVVSRDIYDENGDFMYEEYTFRVGDETLHHFLANLMEETCESS